VYCENNALSLLLCCQINICCALIVVLRTTSNDLETYNVVVYILAKCITIIIIIYCCIKERENLNCRKVSFIDVALFNKRVFIISRLRCCIYKSLSFYLFFYSFLIFEKEKLSNNLNFFCILLECVLVVLYKSLIVS